MTSVLDERAADRAEEALYLVEVDPRRAIVVAGEAAQAARESDDHATLARALRALATATRKLGQPVESERLLRRAVTVAERHGHDVPAAEARMSLSYVLFETGRPTSALRQIERAIDVLSGVDLGRARAQRALLLQRTGRAHEALKEFDQAIPQLRRHGDGMWETRALNNQGVLLAYEGRIEAADAALRRAEDLAGTHGLHTLAALAHWNRGFVAGRAGDVPTALALLAEAEAYFREAGMPEPGVLVDRCEILLSAGLAAEAYETAAEAVTALASHDRHADRAEALVVAAQAALTDRQPRAALATAEEACALLKRQHRPGWLAAAQYTMLRARWECGEDPAALLGAALAAARRLEEAGLAVAAADAKLIVGRLALAAGRAEVARRELASVRPRRGGRADVTTRAWHAKALLQLADGNPAGAMNALRQGIRVIDDYRATLGATELRVHVSTHVTALTSLGLRLALDRGSPRQVLAWLDRCRAGALRFRPARPPSDDALAADLTALRMTAADLEQAQLAGEPTGRLTRALQAAEERIRHRTRTLAAGGAAPAPHVPVADLVTAARDATLLALIRHDSRMTALVVRDGRVTRHELGEIAAPVGRAAENLGFALRMLLAGRGSARGQTAALRALDAGAAELDARLVAPLAARVGGDGPLVLLPPAALAATPWGLLPSLAGRPVTVAASPTAWYRAASATPPAAGPVVAIAGPGLPAARHEVALVAAAHPGALTLCDPDASVREALAAADGARLVHFACHGRLRADNPLFSSLTLTDGPVTVYDLEGLARAPELVVLSACESAQAAVRPGDELLGLSAALLAAGSRSLIASVTPVPDEPAADVMAYLHSELARGATPSAALADTRGRLATDPKRRLVAAAFVCLGAG